MPGIAIWVWILVCAAYDKYIPQLLFYGPKHKQMKKSARKNVRTTIVRYSEAAGCTVSLAGIQSDWALSTLILIFIVFLFLRHSMIKSRTLVLFTQFTSKMEWSVSVIPSVSFGSCNTSKIKCKHELPYWSMNTKKKKQKKNMFYQ